MNQSIWKVPWISKVFHGTIYANKKTLIFKMYHFKCQQAGERWNNGKRFKVNASLLSSHSFSHSLEPTKTNLTPLQTLLFSKDQPDMRWHQSVPKNITLSGQIQILIHTTCSHKLQIHLPQSQSLSFYHCFGSSFAANYKILVWWRSKLRSYAAGMRLFVRAKLFTRKLQLGKGKKGGWSGRGQRGELAVSGRHNSKIGY